MKQLLITTILICGAFFSNAQVTSSDTSKNETDEDIIFSVVEKIASFPGGQEKLYAFLSENLIYPRKAIEEGAQGRVYVKFVVEKDGSLSNITLMKKATPELDEEALRVINLMPKWEPAKQRDVPVRSYYILPIVFQLQTTEPQTVKPVKKNK